MLMNDASIGNSICPSSRIKSIWSRQSSTRTQSASDNDNGANHLSVSRESLSLALVKVLTFWCHSSWMHLERKEDKVYNAIESNAQVNAITTQLDQH